MITRATGFFRCRRIFLTFSAANESKNQSRWLCVTSVSHNISSDGWQTRYLRLSEFLKTILQSNELKNNTWLTSKINQQNSGIHPDLDSFRLICVEVKLFLFVPTLSDGVDKKLFLRVVFASLSQIHVVVQRVLLQTSQIWTFAIFMMWRPLTL